MSLLFILSASYYNRQFIIALKVSLIADSDTLPIFENEWRLNLIISC